jgi:hypothetical protein
MPKLEDEVVFRFWLDAVHDFTAARACGGTALDERSLVGFPLATGVIHVDHGNTRRAGSCSETGDARRYVRGGCEHLAPVDEPELGYEVKYQQD